jgi:hypothetical protein
MAVRTEKRLTIAGIFAGVIFAVGYLVGAVVPGGGDTSDKSITDFYDSSGKRAWAFILALVLVAGCFLMVWFFTELRNRLPEHGLTTVGHTIAMLGAGLVAAGGLIMLAPAGVQMNSDADFVGVPIAHTFAQAGLGVMLVGGMYAFAVAVFLLSLEARRTGALAGWLSITGLVVGVLLLASYIWLPGFLLPLWTIVLGVAAARGTAAYFREPVPEGAARSTASPSASRQERATVESN